MKKTTLFILILLLLSISVSAQQQGHIKLLAVSTDGENQTGSVADLFLKIQPGTGRVFIDTFPLTKLDTQFSTRFAKTVACRYVDVDCSKFDFFYTIESGSVIIGGPSAGSAITLLTISELSKQPFPYDVAVTGTINSGGIIGPVAGIKEKVQAAERSGIRMVLIPTLSIGNNTELEEYLNTTRIEVVKITSLDDALFAITGKTTTKKSKIEVSPVFTFTMEKIADELCSETRTLIVEGTNTSEEEKGTDLFLKGQNATLNKTYYSAASYCFGANVEFRKLELKNKSNYELISIHNNLKKDIETFENTVEDFEIKTIDDLQTYIIVKERLRTAKEYPIDLQTDGNFTNISSERLAYSIERYNSALSWSNFFGTGKKEYVINTESLKKTCENKIAETRGYVDYISIFIDTRPERIQKEIINAQKDFLNGEYELCIFKASKANADASLILEALSISRDQMIELLDQKIELARQTIANVEQEGVFPILGYSYFEYANSLKTSDPDSALLYIGYANELSNLDVYFEKKEINFNLDVDYNFFSMFVLGLFSGVLLASILALYFSKNHD